MSRPTRALLFTWLALLALLATTFGVAHLPLGTAAPFASLAIAAMKAVLVALFFMELRRAPALVVIFAVVAVVALAILFGLSGTDYATRLIHPAPWQP